MSTEEMILEKGLTAPRVTPQQIEDVIADITYHQLNGTLTVCVLTLMNGFQVTGESACASPENFDEEIGQRIAFANAKEKIWVLEGYLLKQRLAEAPSGNGAIDFGEAIKALKLGARVARDGWNGKDMWLALQTPDEHSKMRQPYIYMSPVGGDLIPWLASQADMLAEDWRVVS